MRVLAYEFLSWDTGFGVDLIRPHRSGFDISGLELYFFILILPYLLYFKAKSQT